MSGLPKWLGIILVSTIASACSEPSVETQPGVSLELAQSRSALLDNIHYQLRFEIPGQQQQPIVAAAVISFDLADKRAPLQLDYRHRADSIQALRVNGTALGAHWSQEHIVLPAAVLQRGRNRVEIEFVAGDSSLNRKPDFLYALFVPDRARTAFPLFDQPDLKAIYELTLVIPANWRALANAPEAAVRELPHRRSEYSYQPTEPISSYLFSFVAGEFEALTREVDGRSMTMLHREPDPAKVARNVDAIFALHGESLAWLESYTGIAYPFQKFDFVLIPEFPFNGMEHVGAIQYRASSLLLDEEPPLTDQLSRAQLIAHETAHMWFGNLVTMRWFDDVWTKEVFANFMAVKIVNPGFPALDHELNFLVKHYPLAYAVDRSEGANPIRQALPNLDQAGQLYGYIVYHKAPIMMRQLELLLGEEGLREGLREYLQRFAFGSATWPELIAILDKRTDIDLASWSEVWVKSPGRPEFILQPDAAGDGSYRLQQLDTAGLKRIWPQQFEVLGLAEDLLESETVMAVSGSTPLAPATTKTAMLQLFNADGRGYGLFPATPDILLAWEQLGPVQRGAALITCYEQLLEDHDFDVASHLLRLLHIIRVEQDSLLLKLALGQVLAISQNFLVGVDQQQLRPLAEDALWNAMLAQPERSRTKLLFRYLAALAYSPALVQKVFDIWSRSLQIDKLILEEDDQIELAQTLAILLPAKSADIITRQLQQTSNPDNLRRLEFIAPSLAADEAVRDAFFESLRDAANRGTKEWVSAAVANLHHRARVAQSEKYILPSLELLQEIQVTGDIFFPVDWLRVTLQNHTSPTAAATVREFLEQRPDYNPQLRMKVLQAADNLFRASARRSKLVP